jgi:septal ring factor EnvC (AmiA/AmiB activator)
VRARALIGLLCWAYLAGSAGAATEKPADRAGEKRQELNALRDRIEQLRRDVEQATTDRNEAADALRDSERNISTVQRSLRDLDYQVVTQGRELNRLDARIRLVKAQIEEQRERLAMLVRHRYERGGSDAARLALNGENPAAAARQLGYAGYVAQARADLIRIHNQTLAQLAALENKVSESKKQLSTLRSGQLDEKKKLETERQARQSMLARLSDQIRVQKKEIGTLLRDEQRLTRLVQRLAELRTRSASVRPGKASTGRPAPGQKVEQVADARLANLDFTRLRGRLALPLAGEIVARFGSAREGGGPAWKGLFIQSAAGQGVHAVATGRVVFADWLRGFGNLIILDHGDDYLSLYSNNESLYKQPGEAVRAGDVIASVGNTGGHERAGLYFELRHQSRPFDPLSWVGGSAGRSGGR